MGRGWWWRRLKWRFVGWWTESRMEKKEEERREAESERKKRSTRSDQPLRSEQVACAVLFSKCTVVDRVG